MSTPEIRGTVKLLADPILRKTTHGKPWVTARARFETWERTPAGKWKIKETIPADLSTFDAECVAYLTGCRSGDALTIFGRFRPEVWNNRPVLKVTVSHCAPTSVADPSRRHNAHVRPLTIGGPA